MKKNTIFGLDLAKHIFHLVCLDGKRKKLRRGQMLPYFAQLPQSVIAMEACASSNYWARELISLGHEVKLIPPQHVKSYLRGQKNDYNDALAIAEAAEHGRVRDVPVKTVEQQDKQTLLRSRRRVSVERTRLVNHVRGILTEYGITISKSVPAFRRHLCEIIDEESNLLSSTLTRLIDRYYQQLLALDEELVWHDKQINEQVKLDKDCQRLQELPGFGPIVSYAFKSWLGSGKQFKRGRDASAALGVVPKQHTSGDKQRLSGITKKGDAYLRSLIIHGARSVLRRVEKKDDPLSQWINRLIVTRGKNKAIVALANKMIRIAWVIVARQEKYHPKAA